MNGTTGFARTGDDFALFIRDFYSIGNLMMNDDNDIYRSYTRATWNIGSL